MMQRCLILAAVLLSLLARPVPAQESGLAARGLWLALGVHAVSAGCSGCGGRENGAGGFLDVGGTVGTRLRIGIHTDWDYIDKDSQADATLAGAMAQFYPGSTRQNFVKTVIGLGLHDMPALGGAADYPGPGLLVGVGHDVRISHALSASVQASASAMFFGRTRVTTLHLGIGVTVH